MLTSMLTVSYPDSVLNQLSAKYSLSLIQQQQLHDTLLVIVERTFSCFKSDISIY